MITLQELGIAYRKAKVDLYYSSYASMEAIADYEEELNKNLSDLRRKINGADESWVKKPAFIGTWSLAPKSVDMDVWKSHRRERENDGNGLIFSSPTDEWEYICNTIAEPQNTKKPKAEFRVIAKCSLDFHVLSTLWMMKVGHYYDSKLSECAYGNRLRRTHDEKSINRLSLGSFQPYLKPFRDWRDKGIEAMRISLAVGKKIVALTADVTSFYHELKPAFMLDSVFVNDVLELELTDEQSKLNRLFIRALQAWAKTTPLERGLPVGLPASAVIANMALIELDRCIEQQVVPIYYGRYVDDILLVMENGANFRSTKELWNWLFIRSNGKLAWVNGEEDKKICFQPDYFKQGEGKSEILFANAKNKLFVLADESGKIMVDAIAHQIHERASEWRAMPRLPQSADHVGTDLLAATQSDGEAADNLRKTDALTMRRAGFAMKLRDFEAYERDLLPEAWETHRRAFLRAFIQHVLVLPRYFDLAIYLPRVIRLATACEDFEELSYIVVALEKLCHKVSQDCDISIKSAEIADTNRVMSIWHEQLSSTVRESIAAAFPPRLSKKGKQAWLTHMTHRKSEEDLAPLLKRPLSDKTLQTQQARLFSFDLAHQPFRFIGLPKEMVAQRGIPAKKLVANCCANAHELLPEAVVSGTLLLAKWIKIKGLPHGLLFATRPFNLPELFILNKDAFFESGRTDMKAVVLSVRGFDLGEQVPCFDKHGVLHIPNDAILQKYGIAVSSWKTSLDSWTAAVTRRSDPDTDRYSRLCRLLDTVISQPLDSRYLILPELALPARWFIRIARKLKRRGISFVTGIEYMHASKARLRNQVWSSLLHDGLGFPSLMIYRQDKQRPALHEEQELQRLGGLKLIPERAWGKKPPIIPIIQHGNFRFALLICSELTNISYRAALRGKVDALFVPEWNQDTETFNALVESAALDIHAYIIQCNDRQYGDSRIRAPFKESWQRDILRVKGGITDYCVIGEINVHALREFQSSHRPPGEPFKPVPDGFNDAMDYNRKVLPMGS